MPISQPSYPIETQDLVTFIGDYADSAASVAQAAAASAVSGQRGVANGLATLDATGNVPAAQLGNAPTGSGGTDTDYYQTVEIGGTAKTQRSKLNLIAGSNITLSAADNSGANSTDITITSSGGSGGSSVGSSALGSMGSSKTITAAYAFQTTSGTFTANCALTVNGMVAGGVLNLALTQNSTGGYTLTVNGQAIGVHGAASSLSMVTVWYDGTNYYTGLVA